MHIKPTHEHHMSNKDLGKDFYLVHVDLIILFAPPKLCQCKAKHQFFTFLLQIKNIK